MSGYRVGFVARALADVQKIVKWWKANRESAPRLFQNELDLALLLVAAHPEVGKRIQLRVAADVRAFVLRRSSYTVIYTVHESQRLVMIARVRHMHRRPLAKKREH